MQAFAVQDCMQMVAPCTDGISDAGKMNAPTCSYAHAAKRCIEDIHQIVDLVFL